MITIDNYSFICTSKNGIRLAKPNEMNDPKRKIAIIGTFYNNKKGDKTIQTVEVKRYEKTYIVGCLNSKIQTCYLGKKSKEMQEFESAVRERIPVITNFKIGYAYYKERIGKHIPCIIGKIEHESESKIIFVESQNFNGNTIIDIEGKTYFIDWLSMVPYQYHNLITELQNFPIKLKKYFGIFCEKGLKFDMIALKDSIPILGVAGAIEIK